MGTAELNRRMPVPSNRGRRRLCRFSPQFIEKICGAGADGVIASSVDKRKRSPCDQDADAGRQARKKARRSVPDLPEDILLRVHSFMQLRDAARFACLNHAFLHSWRRYPNLILNRDTIGLNKYKCGQNFSRKVDGILRNHSGIGVKIFRLEYTGILKFDACRYLDSWFQLAVKPGIEEITLVLCKTETAYNFPCSLLPDGARDSVRYLKLGFCAFRPTAELGPLRSLTSLRLFFVSITGDELECLLSSSLALETLDLDNCMEIINLKIPCLRQLRCLSVFGCLRLKVIENKAPNLSSFYLRGHRETLSLGETLQMRKLDLHRTNLVHYARAVLPSRMPNLETLVIGSDNEVVNAPMLATKFPYLKHLTIRLIAGLTFSPSYDYFSLVSFLDASPSLETLILDVSQRRMDHESVFADPNLRQMAERCHGSLKTLKISGFCSAKSLVELTCFGLKNAMSLECLTLDTVHSGALRCDQNPSRSCSPIGMGISMEAPRALSAVRTYIEDKVPPTVKLTVLGPCRRCHAKGRLFLQS
ncbi:hypothetical protein ACP70R_003584 [Stipagrostis hirtigluma subsp. patula]